jgi:polyisoprenoid-binding protein YceI
MIGMKKFGILAIALLLAGSVFAQNKVKVNSVKEESSITYSMKHPLHEWTGESKEVSSILLMDESKTTVYQVAVSAKLSTFDSKNANRDSHMMEVTEAIKFPNVTYVSSSVTIEGNDFTSSGNLNFHGVVQPVALKGKFTKEGTKLIFTGNFDLKMTQFKIDPPSLMGISTNDDFKLEFKVVYQ